MNLTYFASGGDENTWLPFTKVKYYTNAFIVKDNKVSFLCSPYSYSPSPLSQVLLGYKKRGYGLGKYVIRTTLHYTRPDLTTRYNGFGGKVEPGETPLNAATRELEVGSHLEGTYKAIYHVLLKDHLADRKKPE